jgi:hypothetical protein
MSWAESEGRTGGAEDGVGDTPKQRGSTSDTEIGGPGGVNGSHTWREQVGGEMTLNS